MATTSGPGTPSDIPRRFVAGSPTPKRSTTPPQAQKTADKPDDSNTTPPQKGLLETKRREQVRSLYNSIKKVLVDQSEPETKTEKAGSEVEAKVKAKKAVQPPPPDASKSEPAADGDSSKKTDRKVDAEQVDNPSPKPEKEEEAGTARRPESELMASRDKGQDAAKRMADDAANRAFQELVNEEAEEDHTADVEAEAAERAAEEFADDHVEGELKGLHDKNEEGQKRRRHRRKPGEDDEDDTPSIEEVEGTKAVSTGKRVSPLDTVQQPKSVAAKVEGQQAQKSVAPGQTSDDNIQQKLQEQRESNQKAQAENLKQRSENLLDLKEKESKFFDDLHVKAQETRHSSDEANLAFSQQKQSATAELEAIQARGSAETLKNSAELSVEKGQGEVEASRTKADALRERALTATPEEAKQLLSEADRVTAAAEAVRAKASAEMAEAKAAGAKAAGLEITAEDSGAGLESLKSANLEATSMTKFAGADVLDGGAPVGGQAATILPGGTDTNAVGAVGGEPAAVGAAGQAATILPGSTDTNAVGAVGGEPAAVGAATPVGGQAATILPGATDTNAVGAVDGQPAAVGAATPVGTADGDKLGQTPSGTDPKKAEGKPTLGVEKPKETEDAKKPEEKKPEEKKPEEKAAEEKKKPEEEKKPDQQKTEEQKQQQQEKRAEKAEKLQDKASKAEEVARDAQEKANEASARAETAKMDSEKAKMEAESEKYKAELQVSQAKDEMERAKERAQELRRQAAEADPEEAARLRAEADSVLASAQIAQAEAQEVSAQAKVLGAQAAALEAKSNQESAQSAATDSQLENALEFAGAAKDTAAKFSEETEKPDVEAVTVALPELGGDESTSSPTLTSGSTVVVGGLPTVGGGTTLSSGGGSTSLREGGASGSTNPNLSQNSNSAEGKLTPGQGTEPSGGVAETGQEGLAVGVPQLSQPISEWQPTTGEQPTSGLAPVGPGETQRSADLRTENKAAIQEQKAAFRSVRPTTPEISLPSQREQSGTSATARTESPRRDSLDIVKESQANLSELDHQILQAQRDAAQASRDVIAAEGNTYSKELSSIAAQGEAERAKALKVKVEAQQKIEEKRTEQKALLRESTDKLKESELRQREGDREKAEHKSDSRSEKIDQKSSADSERIVGGRSASEQSGHSNQKLVSSNELQPESPARSAEPEQVRIQPVSPQQTEPTPIQAVSSQLADQTKTTEPELTRSQAATSKPAEQAEPGKMFRAEQNSAEKTEPARSQSEIPKPVGKEQSATKPQSEAPKAGVTKKSAFELDAKSQVELPKTAAPVDVEPEPATADKTQSPSEMTRAGQGQVELPSLAELPEQVRGQAVSPRRPEQMRIQPVDPQQTEPTPIQAVSSQLADQTKTTEPELTRSQAATSKPAEQAEPGKMFRAEQNSAEKTEPARSQSEIPKPVGKEQSATKPQSEIPKPVGTEQFAAKPQLETPKPVVSVKSALELDAKTQVELPKTAGSDQASEKAIATDQVLSQTQVPLDITRSIAAVPTTELSTVEATSSVIKDNPSLALGLAKSDDLARLDQPISATETVKQSLGSPALQVGTPKNVEQALDPVAPADKDQQPSNDETLKLNDPSSATDTSKQAFSSPALQVEPVSGDGQDDPAADPKTDDPTKPVDGKNAASDIKIDDPVPKDKDGYGSGNPSGDEEQRDSRETPREQKNQENQAAQERQAAEVDRQREKAAQAEQAATTAQQKASEASNQAYLAKIDTDKAKFVAENERNIAENEVTRARDEMEMAAHRARELRERAASAPPEEAARLNAEADSILASAQSTQAQSQATVARAQVATVQAAEMEAKSQAEVARSENLVSELELSLSEASAARESALKMLEESRLKLESSPLEGSETDELKGSGSGGSLSDELNSLTALGEAPTQTAGLSQMRTLIPGLEPTGGANAGTGSRSSVDPLEHRSAETPVPVPDSSNPEYIAIGQATTAAPSAQETTVESKTQSVAEQKQEVLGKPPGETESRPAQASSCPPPAQTSEKRERLRNVAANESDVERLDQEIEQARAEAERAEKAAVQAEARVYETGLKSIETTGAAERAEAEKAKEKAASEVERKRQQQVEKLDENQSSLTEVKKTSEQKAAKEAAEPVQLAVEPAARENRELGLRETQQVRNQPVGAQPAEPESVRSQPVGAQTAEPESVRNQPVGAQPAEKFRAEQARGKEPDAVSGVGGPVAQPNESQIPQAPLPLPQEILAALEPPKSVPQPATSPPDDTIKEKPLAREVMPTTDVQESVPPVVRAAETSVRVERPKSSSSIAYEPARSAYAKPAGPADMKSAGSAAAKSASPAADDLAIPTDAKSAIPGDQRPSSPAETMPARTTDQKSSNPADASPPSLGSVEPVVPIATPKSTAAAFEPPSPAAVEPAAAVKSESPSKVTRAGQSQAELPSLAVEPEQVRSRPVSPQPAQKMETTKTAEEKLARSVPITPKPAGQPKSAVKLRAEQKLTVRAEPDNPQLKSTNADGSEKSVAEVAGELRLERPKSAGPAAVMPAGLADAKPARQAEAMPARPADAKPSIPADAKPARQAEVMPSSPAAVDSAAAVKAESPSQVTRAGQGPVELPSSGVEPEQVRSRPVSTQQTQHLQPTQPTRQTEQAKTAEPEPSRGQPTTPNHTEQAKPSEMFRAEQNGTKDPDMVRPMAGTVNQPLESRSPQAPQPLPQEILAALEPPKPMQRPVVSAAADTVQEKPVAREVLPTTDIQKTVSQEPRGLSPSAETQNTAQRDPRETSLPTETQNTAHRDPRETSLPTETQNTAHRDPRETSLPTETQKTARREPLDNSTAAEISKTLSEKPRVADPPIPSPRANPVQPLDFQPLVESVESDPTESHTAATQNPMIPVKPTTEPAAEGKQIFVRSKPELPRSPYASRQNFTGAPGPLPAPTPSLSESRHARPPATASDNISKVEAATPAQPIDTSHGSAPQRRREDPGYQKHRQDTEKPDADVLFDRSQKPQRRKDDPGRVLFSKEPLPEESNIPKPARETVLFQTSQKPHKETIEQQVFRKEKLAKREVPPPMTVWTKGSDPDREITVQEEKRVVKEALREMAGHQLSIKKVDMTEDTSKVFAEVEETKAEGLEVKLLKQEFHQETGRELVIEAPKPPLARPSRLEPNAEVEPRRTPIKTEKPPLAPSGKEESWEKLDLDPKPLKSREHGPELEKPEERKHNIYIRSEAQASQGHAHKPLSNHLETAGSEKEHGIKKLKGRPLKPRSIGQRGAGKSQESGGGGGRTKGYNPNRYKKDKHDDSETENKTKESRRHGPHKEHIDTDTGQKITVVRVDLSQQELEDRPQDQHNGRHAVCSTCGTELPAAQAHHCPICAQAGPEVLALTKTNYRFAGQKLFATADTVVASNAARELFQTRQIPAMANLKYWPKLPGHKEILSLRRDS